VLIKEIDNKMKIFLHKATQLLFLVCQEAGKFNVVWLQLVV